MGHRQHWKKRKKMKNKSDRDEWRRCQHIANFISHIAGHKGMKPGFYCKVKVFNEKLQKYEICGKAATKPQNLATHIYTAHYKGDDIKEQYTVKPELGFVARDKVKTLNKLKRSKKRKRSSSTISSIPSTPTTCIDNDNDAAPKNKKRRLR